MTSLAADLPEAPDFLPFPVKSTTLMARHLRTVTGPTGCLHQTIGILSDPEGQPQCYQQVIKHLPRTLCNNQLQLCSHNNKFNKYWINCQLPFHNRISSLQDNPPNSNSKSPSSLPMCLILKILSNLRSKIFLTAILTKKAMVNYLKIVLT